MGQGQVMGESLLEADRAPLPVARWTNVHGYDPSFLSERIDLTKIYKPMLDQGKSRPCSMVRDTNLPITTSPR